MRYFKKNTMTKFQLINVKQILKKKEKCNYQ